VEEAAEQWASATPEVQSEGHGDNGLCMLPGELAPLSIKCAGREHAQPETETVLQQVLHDEPAAQISEVEASDVVSAQEAGLAERGFCLQEEMQMDEDDDTDKLFLCKLNRNPRSLRTALCEGRILQKCRSALETAGHDWKMITGALVFVQPHQYRAAMKALVNKDLQPDIIVFAESFEPLLEETMANVMLQGGERSIPAKWRLGLPAMEESDVATQGSEAACVRYDHQHLIDQSLMTEFTHERTFLCLVRPLKPSASVAQSTTEAEPRQGLNPRRAMSHEETA